MYNKIAHLVLEKAKLEAEIRALRVRTIRTIVFKIGKLTDHNLLDLIEKVEAKLAAVVYNQAEFDDLLDQIEVKLDLG